MDAMKQLNEKLTEVSESEAAARKEQKRRRKARQAARGLTHMRVGDPMDLEEELGVEDYDGA
jgi:hypothetical protein